MGQLTQRALEGLSETAKSVGPILGGKAIADATRRREDKALEYTLGRQKVADTQRDELFRRGTEAYQRENEWRNKPVQITDFIKSPYALNHFAAKTSTGEMFADGLARVAGGTLDKDEASPTKGLILTSEGKPLTGQDLARNWAKVKAYIFQHTNAEKLAHDKLAEAHMRLRNAKTPEEAQPHKQTIAKYQAFLNDPRQRVAQIDHKINMLNMLGGAIKDEGIQKDIARLEKKKDRIWENWNKERDRQNRRRIARGGKGGKDGKDMRGTFGQMVDDFARINKFLNPDKDDRAILKEAKEEAKAYKNDPRVSQALIKMLEVIENEDNLSDEDREAAKKEIYTGLSEIASRSTSGKKAQNKGGIPKPPKGYVLD
jgi:hypothetical protein